ncbi:MAG TPA: HD domain-containing protein [Candidatus Deferrimicrobium sp.]|nr:HD domain-containing protein [Candidatus Deferrimicrobium sp.]
MEQRRIKDFALNDAVTSIFAVRKKDVREYSRGQFVLLELGDCSGRIAGVVWEPDQFCLAELRDGMVVKAQGVVGEYNGKKQVTVQRLRLARDGEYLPGDILPTSSVPEDVRKERILRLTHEIQNEHVKRLVVSFWSDSQFMDAFLKAAAGKLWHHACIGGLSEHSANVASLALRVAEGYDFLNKDFLIFGGLLHDVGKVRQYAATTSIDYTDEGRLVGHIALADSWICQRAAAIESFPDALLTQLRHILLSHQGMHEYASPILPQMPEAFVVFYCDEIDSKMGAIERIREKHGGAGWSEYVKLLDRYLYFGDKQGS